MSIWMIALLVVVFWLVCTAAYVVSFHPSANPADHKSVVLRRTLVAGGPLTWLFIFALLVYFVGLDVRSYAQRKLHE